MTSVDHERENIEKDAEAIEEKFGANADAYAEARSEAAAITGREADKDRWRNIAHEVRDDEPS